MALEILDYLFGIGTASGGKDGEINLSQNSTLNEYHAEDTQKHKDLEVGT